MRSRRFLCAVAAVAVTVGAAAARVAAAPDVAAAGEATGLEAARQLAAAGRHAEAVAAVDALLAADGVWSFSFGGQPVGEAHLGRRFGYFDVLARRALDPALPVDARHVPANARGFDWLHHLTCVDLQTGRRLWTRPFVPHPRVGVDPRNDDLWVWHEAEGWFERVDAATGDTRRHGDLPRSGGGPGVLECLRDGDADVWARTSADTREAMVATCYDVVAARAVPGVPRPAGRSPDGGARVTYDGSQFATTVACLPVPPGPGDATVWTARFPGGTYNPPTWAGADVLFLAGGPYGPGVLYRLAGATGATRWRASLGGFAFVPSMHQIRGGSYAAGGWVPAGVVGDEAWAVDGSGRLRFFTARTGEPTRVVELGGLPIAPPRFADDGTMVVATADGMRAGRWDAGGRSPPAAALALKVRSLLALGRGADAAAAAAAAVRLAPAEPTWEALADALAAAGRAPDAVAARARAMEAGARTESPALRASHGLVWRVPTGAVLTPPVVLGDTVLVAEADGTVLEIDPVACRVVRREQVEAGVSQLRAEGTQLSARGFDGQRRALRALDRPPAADPGDPVTVGDREEPLDPAGVDPGWYVRGGTGRIGRARRVEGRLVRPTAGGGVRELVDGKLVVRPGAFPHLKHWAYAEAGGTPVGCGPGGVYALDASLRPDHLLVDLGGRAGGGDWPTAILAAGDDRTLAVLGRAPERERDTFLQVFSRDGRQGARPPASVRLVPDVEAQSARLVAIEGGYLLSAGELLYVPSDPARPEWRFGLLGAVPPADFAGARSTEPFGVPRVCRDRLVVAAREGGVFVFDLAVVRGR